MSKKYNFKIFTAIFFVTLAICGCKKFVDIEAPTDRISEGSVFNNDLTAIAVLTGIYSNLSSQATSSTSLITLSKLGGLSSDELDLWTGASDVEKAYYKNELSTTLGGVQAGLNAGIEIWSVCYRNIYQCNEAIDGISKSSALSSSVRRQLMGEAKFLRALFYFYLVNLYGDAPIITGTDPETNRAIARASITVVMDFIINDLNEAKDLLNTSFVNSSLQPSANAERTRPTKWAASALLARVYLYNGNNIGAEAEASSVINQSTMFDVATVALNNVFLKNSKEAIWQLQPVTNETNTADASWFVLTNPPSGFSFTKSVYLSQTLLQAFQPGDNRKSDWIGSYLTTTPSATYYFPLKYKAGQDVNVTPTSPNAITEYHMVLRLAEQYLIRAEARARQGDVTGAVADLNIIRKRARATPTVLIPDPLPDFSASLTQQQVIDSTLQEKRIELFTEWGHRWLDLKRTGKADAVMSPITSVVKGGVWQPTDKLYPIPADDVSRSRYILEQNPGYN